MGRIARVNGSLLRYLEAESLVGRSPQCALRLTRSEVSSQHASLRWQGQHWELKDLGSRNGTWLGADRLEPGRLYPVPESSLIGFGHPEEEWRLLSAAPPEVMIVNVANSEQRVPDDGVIGIPSDELPLATVYKSSAGIWCLETEAGRTATLDNGMRFEVAQEPWRFCCPDLTSSTVTSDASALARPVSLHFLVSRDEEYVELQVEFHDRVLHLGSRSHNHLLLTLARARLADADAGQPETSCGWVYKEDLVSAFETAQRVDIEVFRVRKHFARFAPHVAADIIERRTRTRQLRLGINRLRITTL